ncbi:hypothetical protein [Mesobacillus jeotgali]|uniref:hypothetical protein n=1 Tax=Mesobacillus jeotgali TaxID=129985 RepID=UPI000C84752E|nr:hypothetical protein [Mesobacillus jeotgali]
MEATIAVLGGLCFASVVYLGVYFRLIKNKRLELLDWFLISMATFNGLGFGFVMFFTHGGRNSYIHNHLIMNFDSVLTISYILLSITLLLSVLFGWYIAIGMKNTTKKRTKTHLYSNSDYYKKLLIVAWIMLFVSVISYGLFTRAYGGFIDYLAFSSARRSGVFVVANPFSFLQRFGSFSFFSSFVFFAYLIDKNNKTQKKLSIFVGFILSLCFSLYVLYSWEGRVGFVFYIATFFLGYILYSYKSTLAFVRKLSIFSIFSVFLLIFIDAFLGRSGGSLGIVALFTKELSFPFSSFYSIFHSSQYRWFFDVLTAPLLILPMRIWAGMLNIDTASSFNTFLLLGARKGEAGVYGETPVDLLSFVYLQGNVLGVIIIGLMGGIGLYIIHRLVNKVPINSFRSIISANVILYVAIMTVLYGDPHHILVRNFDLIVGFTILAFLLKFRNKKRIC